MRTYVQPIIDAAKISLLRTQVGRIDTRLIDAWSREAKADGSRFEEIKEAYVRACYSRHYRVSAEI